MAIKLAHVKVDGRRVRGMTYVKTAKRVKRILAKEGIICEVEINRYYSDRWYTLECAAQCCRDDEDRRKS